MSSVDFLENRTQKGVLVRATGLACWDHQALDTFYSPGHVSFFSSLEMDSGGIGNTILREDEIGGLLWLLPLQGELIHVVPEFAFTYRYDFARGPFHYLSE